METFVFLLFCIVVAWYIATVTVALVIVSICVGNISKRCKGPLKIYKGE